MTWSDQTMDGHGTCLLSPSLPLSSLFLHTALTVIPYLPLGRGGEEMGEGERREREEGTGCLEKEKEKL